MEYWSRLEGFETDNNSEQVIVWQTEKGAAPPMILLADFPSESISSFS